MNCFEQWRRGGSMGNDDDNEAHLFVQGDDGEWHEIEDCDGVYIEPPSAEEDVLKFREYIRGNMSAEITMHGISFDFFDKAHRQAYARAMAESLYREYWPVDN